MDAWSYTQYAIFAIYALMIIATVITVLNERRDPVRAVSWISVIVMIPIGGLLVFLFFGQSYRKRKIFSRKEIKELLVIDEFSKSQIHHINNMEDESIVSNRHIIKLLLNNSKSLLTNDNSIDIDRKSVV